MTGADDMIGASENGSVFRAILTMRPSGCDKKDVQRNAGVLHPERHELRLIEQEQHAAVGGQFRDVHQSACPAFVSGCDPDAKPVGFRAGHDVEFRFGQGRGLRLRRIAWRGSDIEAGDEQRDQRRAGSFYTPGVEDILVGLSSHHAQEIKSRQQYSAVAVHRARRRRAEPARADAIAAGRCPSSIGCCSTSSKAQRLSPCVP